MGEGAEGEPQREPLEDQPTQRIDAPPTVIQPARKAGRNLKLAIATGLTLAALVIGLLYLGPPYFFALAFVVILIAQGEFYSATRKAGYDPATALGLVAGAVMLAGVFFKGPQAAGLVLFLSLTFCFVWYIAHESRDGVIVNIGVTMLGIAYIPMLGSFAGLLARRPGDSLGVTLTMIGAAAFYDIFAYAGGSRFGKTPLAPAVSPKKTREGALIATVGIIVMAALVAPLLGPWSPAQGALLGVLVAATAPLGDLFESMIKRDLGIKDMGAIFPGHGGALDRIDAILFTAPAIYISLAIHGL